MARRTPGRHAPGHRRDRAKAAPAARSARSGDRRRAVALRRSRLMVAGAATVAVVVVAAWFPADALYHQHQQLAAGSSQLNQLQRQNDALRQEARRLKTPAEVARIARQQFELVTPGQTVYQVLPAAGTATGGRYAGDPGAQVPVTPSGASELPAGSGGDASTGSPAAPAGASAHRDTHGGPSTSSGVFGRIVNTLEFWR